MEKGNSDKKPHNKCEGASWTTIRRHYWQEQASDPSSEWFENERALEGKSPYKNEQKIVLHHPHGRKGCNIYVFEEMPEDEHRDFHKENGYRHNEEEGWH